jgi:hypothetical protein
MQLKPYRWLLAFGAVYAVLTIAWGISGGFIVLDIIGVALLITIVVMTVRVRRYSRRRALDSEAAAMQGDREDDRMPS